MATLKPNQSLPERTKIRLEELHLATKGTASPQSRVAHIQSILGNAEAYATLRALRWPEAVVCPRCHSTRVRLRPAPAELIDQTWREFYQCLECDTTGRDSFFDDLYGLELNENITSLRNWILCWYLSSFCHTPFLAMLLDLPQSVIAHMMGLLRHIDVERREEEVKRLELELKLKKQVQHELIYATTPDFKDKVLEAGTAFPRAAEDAAISFQRSQEAAGAPTYRERLGWRPTIKN